MLFCVSWRVVCDGDGDLGVDLVLVVVCLTCRFFKGAAVRDSEMESCFRFVLDLVDRGGVSIIVAPPATALDPMVSVYYCWSNVRKYVGAEARL